MRQIFMNKIKELCFSVFAFIMIISAIAYSEPEKLAHVTQIFAQYSPIQYGVPDDIVGVWHGNQQDILIRDHQLILYKGLDEQKESQKFIPSVTFVQEDFDMKNVPDNEHRTLYILNFEPSSETDFENDSQKSIFMVYDDQTNSLILEDGKTFKH